MELLRTPDGYLLKPATVSISDLKGILRKPRKPISVEMMRGRSTPGSAVIGLDTNVLVRYLAQDDARQSAIASRLIENTLTEDVPGFVSAIVLVDGMGDAGPLRRERGRVATIVEGLLRARTVIVEDAEIAWRAVETFRGGRADFADCMTRAFATAAGSELVYTFDKVAARDAGTTLLS